MYRDDAPRPDAPLEYAPMAWVKLDSSSFLVTVANERARIRFELVPGVDFRSRIRLDFIDSLEAFLAESGSRGLELNCSLTGAATGVGTSSGAESPVTLIHDRAEGGYAFWLRDDADPGTLQRQLSVNHMPYRKTLRNLKQQLTKAVSYSELIQTILGDLPNREEKTIATIARYQGLAMEQLRWAMAEVTADPVRRRPIPRIKKHILVVDDEEIMTSLMAELMKAGHHKVTTLTSARSALKAIAVGSRTYDLALIDHEMPDMDGAMLATEVHRIDAALPMVLYSHQDPRVLPVLPGVRHILARPLDLSELSRVIHEVLETGRDSQGR
ncbi:MAG: response regulator [Proteobacteria bacterium]|nr:response regulator [Pseudomonadota bacterium]MDA1302675.1 response regulator [Pseudomonadota bacterium]